MHKLLMAGLLTLATSGAWAQQCPGGVPCGVVSTGPDASHTPVSVATFRNECMSNLTNLASQKLQAQLKNDKAVTLQVLAAATLSETQLGASCAKVCDDYAFVSNKISWAHVSVGYISEPEHTEQKVFGAMPKPALPGKAELDSCMPHQATMNWCPKSGSGVGAGPSRIENPLDKIKVCISGGDALQNMNFTDADAARNCGRPNIVDAAERIKTEHKCITDSIKVEEKLKQDAADKAAQEKAAKAAADKAAANGSAQMPNAGMTVAPVIRKKP